jgi:multicomponent Na+:H+ antiporter subunit D
MTTFDIELLVLLPILLPLTFAILMLFAWKNLQFQRLMNLVAGSASFIVSIVLISTIYVNGIQVVAIGGWKIPYGIVLVADNFSAIMVLMSGLMGFAVAFYSIVTVDKKNEQHFYYPLLQILLMGVNGAFLTGDMFNLYVWFEVMLISSFVLLALGGKQEQLEGAVKYVTLNLISSMIFLSAVGILYGLTGTLNMADLAVKVQLVENQGLVTVVAMMFLVSFGIKSAVFPLFSWLPASYHTPPVAVSALFAGLLTKVGVYTMYRVFTLIFDINNEFIGTVILIIAGFTMLTGVLGAAAQNDFRRILSFHIVSQVGYMVMALGLMTAFSFAAGIFYIVYHIITKTNLFFISGIVERIKGTYNLDTLGGLFKKYPSVSLLFLISAFTLSGIPPFAGFWAKFTVALAGFRIEQYFIVGLSLFVGLLTLYSMTKIWNYAFWQDEKQESEVEKEFSEIPIHRKYLLYSPSIFMTLVILLLSLFAGSAFEFAQLTGEQLANPQYYINAVLGGK